MKQRGADIEPTYFADASAWRAWLTEHHDNTDELWIRLNKKHVEPRGLTWHEAVVEALCFGWIDSQSYSMGADAVRQRWTPRRRGSVWSSVNIATVERLITEQRMQPSGLRAYEARKPERSGIYAHEQVQAALTDEQEALLRADERAAIFWDRATPGYRKIASNWVGSAKQEATRERRLHQLIADCADGQLINSQRYGDEPSWVAKARAAQGE